MCKHEILLQRSFLWESVLAVDSIREAILRIYSSCDREAGTNDSEAFSIIISKLIQTVYGFA
jgi:hypothetical protein